MTHLIKTCKISASTFFFCKTVNGKGKTPHLNMFQKESFTRCDKCEERKSRHRPTCSLTDSNFNRLDHRFDRSYIGQTQSIIMSTLNIITTTFKEKYSGLSPRRAVCKVNISNHVSVFVRKLLALANASLN